jgi:hypothetical protein
VAAGGVGGGRDGAGCCERKDTCVHDRGGGEMDGSREGWCVCVSCLKCGGYVCCLRGCWFGGRVRDKKCAKCFGKSCRVTKTHRKWIFFDAMRIKMLH